MVYEYSHSKTGKIFLAQQHSCFLSHNKLHGQVGACLYGELCTYEIQGSIKTGFSEVHEKVLFTVWGQRKWIQGRLRKRHFLMYCFRKVLSTALSLSLPPAGEFTILSLLSLCDLWCSSKQTSFSHKSPSANPPLPLPPFFQLLLIRAFDRYTAQQGGWNGRQLQSNCLFIWWGSTVRV